MLNATRMTNHCRQRRHGLAISRLVGDGKHFIVNTSHNGNGPLYRNASHDLAHPPHATTGTRPTAYTVPPKVDASM
jgi:endoglucanase